MDTRRNARRYFLAFFAVVVLFVSTAVVVALTQPNEDDVFTGCLNQQSGVLNKVAVGFEPIMLCNPQELQITWDRAAPAFENRIAALEERVAELEEPFGTLELFVDCDAGDTIADALAEAHNHAGPVKVAISGVCEENLGIDRDDVTLFGLDRSDGIRAASSTTTVYIRDARGVRLENLTISGGTAGIEVTGGSAFLADHLTVQDTTIWAIIVEVGSSAGLNDCSIIDNASFGLTASGGDIFVRDCSLSGNHIGAYAEDGGTFSIFNSTLIGNDLGLLAWTGGVARVVGSTFETNGTGVSAGLNSAVEVRDGSRIAGNTGEGAVASGASILTVEGTVIENNGAQGILAHQGSLVRVYSTTIRGNVSHGIELSDQSIGTGGSVRPGDDPVQILDNGGWGIDCAGPPGFPEVQNGFDDIAQIQFSGNIAGDTNCP